MVKDMFTRINKVIDENNYTEEDSAGEESSNESIKHVEESKEDAGVDLSLSLINKQIGATSEEASSANYSEEVQCKKIENFRQTDLKSYFKK